MSSAVLGIEHLVPSWWCCVRRFRWYRFVCHFLGHTRKSVTRMSVTRKSVTRMSVTGKSVTRVRL